MWLDNASNIDMLFYKPYAQLIINTVKKKDYNPLTIGLFGLWGSGKSTLLELICSGLNTKESNIICVRLNAWMFEGYEDAKSALIESLLSEIKENQTKMAVAKEFIDKLIKRVDFFKLGTTALTKGLPLLASIATGNPMPFTLSIASDLTNASEVTSNVISMAKEFKSEFIKDKQEESTIENIKLFREDFANLLDSSTIDNMVVLVDDLDRCTPDRIIDTLEAIKLFLSVPKTTFVIAADETVIQYAIKKRYPPIDGSNVDISEEYIEKIIQLPIYIPELSSKDIENYLLILVAQLYLKHDVFQTLLSKVFEKGIIVRDESISLEELNNIIDSLNSPFEDEVVKIAYKQDVEIINKIKTIVSTTLKGNPRQAKRFLNTFITKKELSKMYFGEELDLQILAKLLVLQKLNIDLFKQLNEWNKEFDGTNQKLEEIVKKASQTEKVDSDINAQWFTPKMGKWLECEPQDIYNKRLDKYFYLSREVLNKNNQLYDGICEQSKIMLEKIQNNQEATIAGVMEELKQMPNNIIDEVLGVEIQKFKDGRERLFILRQLFKYFEGYRGRISTILPFLPKDMLGPSCVPYMKAILAEDITLIKPILNDMNGRNLNSKIHEMIVSRITVLGSEKNGHI